jgi:hypothetical protein
MTEFFPTYITFFCHMSFYFCPTSCRSENDRLLLPRVNRKGLLSSRDTKCLGVNKHTDQSMGSCLFPTLLPLIYCIGHYFNPSVRVKFSSFDLWDSDASNMVLLVHLPQRQHLRRLWLDRETSAACGFGTGRRRSGPARGLRG